METFAFFVWIMMATLQTTYCIISTSCVKTCVGQSNGNYQHCSDCHYYVACSNGYKYIMPCPPNLVWDDVKKRCEWTSSTCNATTLFRLLLRPRQECVESCVGRSDGNYQHCLNCHQYVACSNGYKYAMPCPSNLVWDDIKKRCEWTSSTCNERATETNASLIGSDSDCVESCVGQRDGNYQHCSDCHQYVACSNEYDYIMSCPENLVWDDRNKNCEWTSNTCNGTFPESVKRAIVDEPSGCVNSCVGQPDGNYQHCSDCHRYVACSNWYEYIMPCPSNLVWDDIKKRCDWMSLTCNLTTHESSTAKPFTQIPGCVETCVDRMDGNYQYCSDCHHYVACSNGYKYVIACPSGLLWDDVGKMCDWSSASCL